MQRYKASLDTNPETKKLIVDYVSLDVEGAEAIILEGFHLDEYQLHLFTVERPKEALTSLLPAHRFEHLQRLPRWGETPWVKTHIFSHQSKLSK